MRDGEGGGEDDPLLLALSAWAVFELDSFCVVEVEEEEEEEEEEEGTRMFLKFRSSALFLFISCCLREIFRESAKSALRNIALYVKSCCTIVLSFAINSFRAAEAA